MFVGAVYLVHRWRMKRNDDVKTGARVTMSGAIAAAVVLVARPFRTVEPMPILR